MSKKYIFKSFPNTITGRYQNSNKGQRSKDYKNTKGDKDDSTATGKSSYNYEDSSKFLEGKNYDRNDVTIKRVYSSFRFYNILRNAMNEHKLIKYIDENQSSIDNISTGDYIEFKGSLKLNSLLNCIDNCILILTNYGTSSLDKLFDNTSLGPLTYTIILELRKTGLDTYYINLLNSFKPYFKVLNDKGFIIPSDFITDIPGSAVEIIPISICD